MMARHYEPVFPILEELGVGLVAFSPMANGLLTGQYGKRQRFDAATDYRAAMPQFTDKAVGQNAALLNLLADMAAKKGATSAQISMAWMLCKHPWIVPIPGTRKEDRMKENAGATDVYLTPSEMRACAHPDCNFVHIGITCKPDKEIEFYTSGAFQPTNITFHSQKAEVFGDTGVVLTDCDYSLLLDGKETTHHFMVTEVYTQDENRCKLVTFSFTALVY